MKKLFYIVMATFISVFVISCEEDDAGDGDGISGTWSGVSYAINFSVTITDSEGNEEEISCSSELLQGSEDACENFPCDWDEETESCGSAAADLFSDDGGGVTLVLGSDGMAAWVELWEESYDGQTHTDECASTGTWTTSSGNINLTSTTGENMDDCNVFVAISENPIPYTASGDDMSWTIPLESLYGGDYYDDDYDYDDDDGPPACLQECEGWDDAFSETAACEWLDALENGLDNACMSGCDEDTMAIMEEHAEYCTECLADESCDDDDYDYYDDEYPDFDLSNSSMTIIWSK